MYTQLSTHQPGTLKSYCLISTLFLCGLGGLNGCMSEKTLLSEKQVISSDEMMMDMMGEMKDEVSEEPLMSSSSTDDFISSSELLLGKGADAFETIQDGEISTLHRGCQGAQHLWVSLRLPNHSPDAYGLELTLVDQDDTLLAPPFTLEGEEWLGYDVEDQSTQGSEIIGLTLVIFDPMGVVGKEALVRTKVFVGEVTLESRVWVEVQWGADAC